MRQVKITDLPPADTLTGDELTVVVQSGVSKKATVEQIVNNASSDSQYWATVAQSAANTASGFANQTNADSQAAAASASDASNSADAAASSAQDADYSATVSYNQSVISTNQAGISTAQAGIATAQAVLAQGYADDAQASATAAQASAGSSANSAQLSYEWANKLDGPVQDGEYSAHYWANQAASAGGSTIKVFPAGENLGGQRLVVLRNGQLFYADTTDTADLGLVIGMTVAAATTGQDTQVQFLGDLTEPSWSWTVGSPVYFNASGVPTQTQPVSGFSQIVGFASAATKIYIQLREPIALN